MTVTTSIEVRNHVGTLLYTTNEPDLARAWCRNNAARHPTAYVEEVTTMVSRRRIYRPRNHLRVVGAA